MRGADVLLGRQLVLHDIDFSVGAGEFVILLGNNGSGKTTLVKSLLGLIPLARGRVELFGEPLGAFKRRELIGYVPQRLTAASGVPATVMEVVISARARRSGWGRPYNADDRAAAMGALEAVDLVDLSDSPVGLLSGGQQQRVLIARALAVEPQVLVLDEPVASVDLAHQETFASTVRDLNRRGTSILLVAHALGAMEPLARRAVVLQGGHVVYDGPPEGQGRLEAHAHHHHPEAERDQRPSRGP
jgi:zinc transport system ATP-binding protein